MEPASSLAFPGSRALAGWWRQLQAHRPHRLWFGYLFLHRVEALVEDVAARPVDDLARLALKALTLPGPGDDLEPLRRLHLPASALSRVLRDLDREGLIEQATAGRWNLTERGNQALQLGHYPHARKERRVFPFVERLTPNGERRLPPHYLPVAEMLAPAWHVNNGVRFDLALLRESVNQPDEWKRRFGFPEEVRAVVAASEVSPDWRQVVLDRTERPFVAVIQAEGDDGPLLAFAAQEGWRLQSAEPVLRLPASAREAFSDLAEPPLERWREAWVQWCRQRNFPPAEADECRLTPRGYLIDVEAPDRFVQRLHAARSDLLRNEAWLLAGDGFLRAGALLRLVGGNS